MPIWNPKTAPLPQLSDDILKGLLKKYDANGDGKLSKAELKVVFRAFGARFGGWRAGRVLIHADGNEDGFINEEEMKGFVEYAIKKGYTVT